MSKPTGLHLPATWRDAILHMSPVRYVSDRGPLFSPNVRDSHTTALELAITHGRHEWVDELLEHGADVNDFVGSAMRTYGQVAIVHQNHKAYSSLLRHHYAPARTDRYGRNDAHVAAIHDSFTCLSLITNHQHLFMQLDEKGYAPFHYACMGRGHFRTAHIILRAMQHDAFDSSMGASATHYATITQDDALVKACIARFGVQATDRNGNTPLHWAIPTGSYHVALSLMAGGASPDERNQQGQTPFDLLCEVANPAQRNLLATLVD